MTVISAGAPCIYVKRFGGAFHVYDENTGIYLGQADIIRGFAHYFGAKGGAHDGFSCVIRGGIDGLVNALAEGIRNGRDDRR